MRPATDYVALAVAAFISVSCNGMPSPVAPSSQQLDSGSEVGAEGPSGAEGPPDGGQVEPAAVPSPHFVEPVWTIAVPNAPWALLPVPSGGLVAVSITVEQQAFATLLFTHLDPWAPAAPSQVLDSGCYLELAGIAPTAQGLAVASVNRPWCRDPRGPLEVLSGAESALVKLDASGRLVEVLQIPAPAFGSFEIDPAGDLITAGQRSPTEHVVEKRAADGALLWGVPLSPGDALVSFDAASDQEGGVIVTSLKRTTDTARLPCTIARYDASGTLAWSRDLDGFVESVGQPRVLRGGDIVVPARVRGSVSWGAHAWTTERREIVLLVLTADGKPKQAARTGMDPSDGAAMKPHRLSDGRLVVHGRRDDGCPAIAMYSADVRPVSSWTLKIADADCRAVTLSDASASVAEAADGTIVLVGWKPRAGTVLWDGFALGLQL